MNLDKLMRSLKGIADARRGARYRCIIVFVRNAEDEQPLVGEGTWEGWITDAPRGSGGFGYDPAFIPAAETRTAAEMSASEKHAVSHRGQAMRLFLAQFNARSAG
jgi:XTP/dITP diphosphohydrolase